MDFSKLITHYKDGSRRHRNPFTQTESWYSPDRKNRPILTNRDHDISPLKPKTREDYCPFCESRYWETTPEKSRLIFQNGSWQCLDGLQPDKIFTRAADFRRIGNLYEILSTSYWKKQYGYCLSDKNKIRKNKYLESDLGRKHVLELLQSKYNNEKLSRKIINDLNDPELSATDPFFGGSHELVIPRRHYRPDAKTTADICSTGCLSVDEHVRYFHFTCFTAQDIYDNNPHVKYVCIYTNWGGTGGASLPHLHRQILGLDYTGPIINRIYKLKQKNSNLFYDLVQFIKHQSLIICENEGALAYADIGLPFPSVNVISKSLASPLNAEPPQLKPMSDIIHALHRVMGESLPCNEEWFYTPEKRKLKIPWHIQIKWRINTHAGFEGATGYYVVPLAPADIREKMVSGLKTLDTVGYRQPFYIGDESPGKVDYF